MSLATHKLESILHNVIHKQTGLHNDTFKVWIEEFFSNAEINADKSLDDRRSNKESFKKENKSMEDIFNIEIKEENDAYLKCKYHFKIFLVKYQKVCIMHFEFIDDLQKLLLLLLPLIPDDNYLMSSIDYLKKIKNGFEIYNSRYSQQNNDLPSNPVPEMQNMGLTLLDMFKDNVLILQILDIFMSDLFIWDQDKRIIEASGILYKILKINNEVWLRTLFGPLKNPSEAKRIHDAFASRQLDKFFQICTNERYELYPPDVGLIIWDTIDYFNKMFEQVNTNILTCSQRELYNAAKNFLNNIKKKPEPEWESVFREQLNKYYPVQELY